MELNASAEGQSTSVIFETWLYTYKEDSVKPGFCSSKKLLKIWKKKYFILLKDNGNPEIKIYSKKPTNLKEKAERVSIEKGYQVFQRSSWKGKSFICQLSLNDKELYLSLGEQHLCDFLLFFLRTLSALKQDSKCGIDFVVRPEKSKDTQRLGCSSSVCLLHISKWGVTLALQLSRNIVGQWPLRCIRTYECTGQGRFMFTVGQLSPSGYAQMAFKTRLGQDGVIFNAMERSVEEALREDNAFLNCANTGQSRALLQKKYLSDELTGLSHMTEMSLDPSFDQHLKKLARDIYDHLKTYIRDDRYVSEERLDEVRPQYQKLSSSTPTPLLSATGLVQSSCRGKLPLPSQNSDCVFSLRNLDKEEGSGGSSNAPRDDVAWTCGSASTDAGVFEREDGWETCSSTKPPGMSNIKSSGWSTSEVSSPRTMNKSEFGDNAGNDEVDCGVKSRHYLKMDCINSCSSDEKGNNNSTTCVTTNFGNPYLVPSPSVINASLASEYLVPGSPPIPQLSKKNMENKEHKNTTPNNNCTVVNPGSTVSDRKNESSPVGVGKTMPPKSKPPLPSKECYVQADIEQKKNKHISLADNYLAVPNMENVDTDKGNSSSISKEEPAKNEDKSKATEATSHYELANDNIRSIYHAFGTPLTTGSQPQLYDPSLDKVISLGDETYLAVDGELLASLQNQADRDNMKSNDSKVKKKPKPKVPTSKLSLMIKSVNKNCVEPESSTRSQLEMSQNFIKGVTPNSETVVFTKSKKGDGTT